MNINLPGRELKAYTRMPMLNTSITDFNGIDHQALMNAHPLTNQPPGVDTSTPAVSELKNEWGQPNYGYIAGSQAVQGIMAYLRNKRKDRDFRDYDRTQQNPLLQIPANPNTTDASLYGDVVLKKGGLTASKAAEMLRDGTANKKKLTGKQKKYFQCVKHGGCKKEYGGEIEDELERDIFAEPVEQNVEEVQDTQQTLSQETNDFLPPFTSSAARADLESYSRAPTDVNSFKQNIAKSEGAGYFDPTGIKNEKGEPASSAFGKYQFIKDTRQAVRAKFFPYMGKEEFEDKYKSSPQFQEQVMDQYSGYLLNKYKNPSVAATAFFLGEGKANAQRSHNPGNGNISLGQYLSKAGYAKGGMLGKELPSTVPDVPLFSNESIYSTPENPGGRWEGEKFIPKYKQGGSYYLEDNQIAELKRQGYKIE